ncbi:MAG: cytochrome c biogenesis protein CcsA [Pirellulales bacterium]
MATSEALRPKQLSTESAAPLFSDGVRFSLYEVLSALASLRLTVVLFALSIFLVFAGTLAQKDHDVWYVVDHAYFRVWIAQIDLLGFERLVQMFAPVKWQLSGSIPFPGGNSLGLALLVNLLAAHAVRFKVAASGRRLHIGLAVIAMGVLATVLAVRSGMRDTLASELSPEFCNNLWHIMRAVFAGIVLLGGYGLALTSRHRGRFEWKALLAIDLILAGVAFWLFFTPSARLDDSGLRILWQLIKGGVAGGVLLAGCVMVFRKRAGVVLLHGGVALLMCSELLTGLMSVESQMQIDEGSSANYSSDIRQAQLAVIDKSEPKNDRVTVVPQSRLENNVGSEARIDDPQLPFTIQVLRWLHNSRLAAPQAGVSNPATAGIGKEVVAEDIRAATGTDRDQKADLPSLYAELFDRQSGKSLGVYLFSMLTEEQPIQVDGHEYFVGLRFKRVYYPFTVALKDFRFDRYTGTNTAKNYSSQVQLTDPTQNVDREVLIWMNNPLRYAGLTFYQQNFDERTEQTSVLQVVRNPGWMMPYVACMLVATGMLAHFGVVLVRFLRRREEEAAWDAVDKRNAIGAASNLGRWGQFTTYFPALVVVLCGLYVASKARLPESPPSEVQIYEFGKLPLAYEGRVKPYDTVARNALQILSGRQEVILVDNEGEEASRLPAIRWLLDLISGAPAAAHQPVFRIENLDLLQTLGLKPREGNFRYSYSEIEDKGKEFDDQVKLANKQPEAERSLYQKKVLELANKKFLFQLLGASFRTPPISMEPGQLQASLQQTQAIIEQLRAAQAPHAVPPTEVDGQWLALMEAEFDLIRARVQNQPTNPATSALAVMLDAYARGDATTFNQQLAAYRTILADYEKSLDANRPKLAAAGLAKSEILSQRAVDFEVFYNQLSPIYYASVLYLIAFMLSVLSWIFWTAPLRRASMWLLVFTFVFHTLALAGRIYISGRPPVTNLYSAAIFIGWGCVLLALVFESIYRLGVGNIVAAVIGFLTLLVAHFLSLDGDTFIVLQAVLDTQFWLATHVVCIALGNSTSFVAGMIGILYIVLDHLFGVLNQNDRRQFSRMIYGTLCFAIFFSFVGTVLGGLWADDSWGRFWGWDPKENGALMIVLYNALCLHARWGGMVKERGLALLAVGGNIVATWSLFGVNAFGVGLHAYGGSDRSTSMWLLTFATSQVAVIVLGLLPAEMFRHGEATKLRSS